MKCFEEYLIPTQTKLFKMISDMYGKKATVSKGDYILVRGEAPILLVAHLDTVHKEPVRDICKSEEGNIIMSPQGIGGDDRCGVYALNTVYERATAKPWLLFTCNEEVGGLGAHTFSDDYVKERLPEELDTLKMIVEIDRRGKDDAVYYDCANDEFEDYITSKGFKTNYGSFSDISIIAPTLGIAAVNLSSGYYNAHTQYEYIDRKELNATVNKVLSIVEDTVDDDFPVYEYIEDEYSFDYYKWKDWEKYETTIEPENSDFMYQREYDALLEFHSKEELDEIIYQLGESWIEYLFESEFGGTFEEVFCEEDEEEDV